MNLSPLGREYLKLQITTVPASDPDAWEASFDGGETWSTALDLDGSSAWLLAGSDATVGSAVAVVTSNTRPVLRLVDDPEIIIRGGPLVEVG